MKIVLSSLLLLIFLLSTKSIRANGPETTGIDSTARDFTLNTIQGNEATLSDITKDKYVVLIVLRGWPGYQCPICTRQVGEFLSYEEEFRKRNVTVFMVYPGPGKYLEDHANEFIEDTVFPDNFIFALDPDYTFTNLYGLRWDEDGETAYPSTFIIDKNMKINFSKISDSHGGRTKAEDVLKELDRIKN